nr:MAG TPA: hypothetical protein [Caudoviricetes sp.]
MVSESQRYTRESVTPSGETSGAFLFWRGLYD